MGEPIRSLADVNRTELARRTPYTVSHISRVLAGERMPSSVCATILASELGLEVGEFLAMLPGFKERMPV